jgi:hypothetical protein
MSSESEQQDWDEFVAEHNGQYTWVCSCGKSSVFAYDLERTQRRAEGHEINCGGEVSVEHET